MSATTRVGTRVGTRLGAIDVGTNTTRLLAVEVGSAELAELERTLTFTRLGEGLDASRRISPAAVERTVAAIGRYVQRCRELDAERIRIAGTSAVREAANRDELLRAVEAATGCAMEVLSGEKEAALSFAGATQDLGVGRYLVCDIGGGSTELAAGRKPAGGPGAVSPEIEGRVSLPLGVVRLTERHLASDPPTPDELASLEADVERILEGVEGVRLDPAGTRLVGVAGTVTSLAAVRLGLEVYDPKAVHGSRLTSNDVEELYRKLAAMPLAERESLPPLPPGRADVIVAGCAILSRVMARWSFRDVQVSEKDILDGLVLEMIGGT